MQTRASQAYFFVFEATPAGLAHDEFSGVGKHYNKNYQVLHTAHENEVGDERTPSIAVESFHNLNKPNEPSVPTPFNCMYWIIHGIGIGPYAPRHGSNGRCMNFTLSTIPCAAHVHKPISIYTKYIYIYVYKFTSPSELLEDLVDVRQRISVFEGRGGRVVFQGGCMSHILPPKRMGVSRDTRYLSRGAD